MSRLGEHALTYRPGAVLPTCRSCSEKEIKQLQGWKATVENLMERFEDLIRQTQLLAEIEEPSSSRLDGVDAAAAAEEGLGPMAAGVARSTILTATHHVQLNKLRWVTQRLMHTVSTATYRMRISCEDQGGRAWRSC